SPVRGRAGDHRRLELQRICERARTPAPRRERRADTQMQAVPEETLWLIRLVAVMCSESSIADDGVSASATLVSIPHYSETPACFHIPGTHFLNLGRHPQQPDSDARDPSRGTCPQSA